MNKILTQLKRSALALLALVIPGCSRDPNLKWILDGRVEVPAAEREALQSVFAGVRPSEVEIVVGDGPGGYGARSVRVEDGRVVSLSTHGDVDTEPLAVFSALRRWSSSRSSLTRLDGLGPWSRLETLRLELTPLDSLEGIIVCCPRLVELAVSHGPIDDLEPLAGLDHLERLRLDRSALTSLASAPALPSVKELSLTSGPLESLSGLEAFTALEKLQLFGVKPLHGLGDLPALASLRELALYQNGLTALSGLPDLPSLRRIETSDNKILSVQLEGLPKLEELEIHEKDLLSVELGTLPSLKTVDLRGEGSLFDDGGRLRRLVIETQPALESLDLRRNHLRDLAGLAPQPALRQVRLDRNPFDHLEHFAAGFPSLRHVSVHRTEVRELPQDIERSGVAISYDPAEIEANMWEGVLRDAFEASKASFVLKLPSGGGGLQGHRSSCSLRTATFSTPRLNCTGSIEELSGLVHLPLVEVDPISPGAGVHEFPVRATLRTRTGRARIYLKYELDVRGRAEALAGYRDPERPWFELGDGREPGDVMKGYSFAEAVPGRPGSTSGEAHVLVDQLVVWVEGLDGATGIEYVLESPYR